MKEEVHVFTIRLPIELGKLLKKLAYEEQRSMNAIMRTALSKHLKLPKTTNK